MTIYRGQEIFKVVHHLVGEFIILTSLDGYSITSGKIISVGEPLKSPRNPEISYIKFSLDGGQHIQISNDPYESMMYLLTTVETISFKLTGLIPDAKN